jgi:hypothetical protein
MSNFNFNTFKKIRKYTEVTFLHTTQFSRLSEDFYKTDPNNKQGCQMVCFQTKNPNLGKLWRTLEWKMLVYFMVTWNILGTVI